MVTTTKALFLKAKHMVLGDITGQTGRSTMAYGTKAKSTVTESGSPKKVRHIMVLGPKEKQAAMADMFGKTVINTMESGSSD